GRLPSRHTSAPRRHLVRCGRRGSENEKLQGKRQKGKRNCLAGGPRRCGGGGQHQLSRPASRGGGAVRPRPPTARYYSKSAHGPKAILPAAGKIYGAPRCQGGVTVTAEGKSCSGVAGASRTPPRRSAPDGPTGASKTPPRPPKLTCPGVEYDCSIMSA